MVGINKHVQMVTYALVLVTLKGKSLKILTPSFVTKSSKIFTAEISRVKRKWERWSLNWMQKREMDIHKDTQNIWLSMMSCIFTIYHSRVQKLVHSGQQTHNIHSNFPSQTYTSQQPRQWGRSFSNMKWKIRNSQSFFLRNVGVWREILEFGGEDLSFWIY